METATERSVVDLKGAAARRISSACVAGTPLRGLSLVAGAALLAALFGASPARAQLCASTGDDCSSLSCCEGVCDQNPFDSSQTCKSGCEAGMRGLYLPGQLAIGRDPGDNERAYVFDNQKGNFATLLTTGDNWGDSRAVTAMAWGDIDGDGLEELAVGRNAGDNARVNVYDDQAHGFALLASVGGGWGDSRAASALAFGDLNGDGVDELLVGRNAGENERLFIYDFDGNQLRAIQGLFSGWGDSRGASAIATGDIDGDGRDEIVVGRTAGDGSRVVILDDMQEGFRSLGSLGDGWGDSRGTTALAMADVDGNGRVELLVGRNAGDNARGYLLWKETSDPFVPFQTAQELGNGWGDSRGTTALAFEDLNADGVPDIAAGRNAGDNLRVQVIGLDVTLQPVWSMALGTGWGDDRGCTALAAGPFNVTTAPRNELAMGRSAGENDRVIVEELFPETGSVTDVRRFGDGWGDSRSCQALAFAPAPRDRDGDGLLDAWETRGIDADCDGAVDLPLNTAPYNADINHKDLFLELDWMAGEAPTRQTVQAVVRAFSLAPVDAGSKMNPDGSLGITLHVDTGTLADSASGEGGVVGNCNNGLDDDGDGGPDQLDPECPAVAENLGGGNQLLAQRVSRLDGPFYTIKAANFDAARRFAFRYGVIGRPAQRDPTLSEDGAGPLTCQDGIDNGGEGLQDGGDPDCQGDPTLSEGGGGPNTCGDTLDNDGDGVLDGADSDCQYGGGWGEIGGNDFIEYNHDGGTILHEFGHTLNLGHGGFVDGAVDNSNCKPNYLSVMNYDYQFGIPQVATSLQGTDFDGDSILEILDFSPPRHDFVDGTTGLAPLRTGATGDLVESSLLETTVLDAFDTENMFIFSSGQAVIAGMAGAANAREQGQAAGTCLNALDDDADGLIDAFNPNAAEDGTGVASSCSNGVDDNNDGVADQFDPDCQTDLDCIGVKVAAPVNQPPDWSGDGIIAGTPVAPLALRVDIDKEDATTGQPSSCSGNQGTGATLKFSDDWSSISLPFLHFGDSADGPINAITILEPTYEQLRAHRSSLFASDLSLDLALDPVRVRTWQTTILQAQVTNLSAATARAPELVILLPHGLRFVSGEGCELAPSVARHSSRHRRHHDKPQKLVCTTDAIPGRGSVQLDMQLQVEPSFHGPFAWIRGEVSGGTGKDNNEDNNEADALLLRAYPRHFRPRVFPRAPLRPFPGWPW